MPLRFCSSGRAKKNKLPLLDQQGLAADISTPHQNQRQNVSFVLPGVFLIGRIAVGVLAGWAYVTELLLIRWVAVGVLTGRN